MEHLETAQAPGRTEPRHDSDPVDPEPNQDSESDCAEPREGSDSVDPESNQDSKSYYVEPGHDSDPADPGPNQDPESEQSPDPDGSDQDINPEVFGYFTFDKTTGTIIDYDSSGGAAVIIPSSLNDITVSAIGKEAFKGKGLS